MQNATPTVVSLVIERDGAVLLGRRSSSKDHAPGKWETISGRVEENETLAEAAQREALEETGLVVEVLEQLDSFMFRRGADTVETHGVTFHCRVRSGSERLSEEHDRFTWATLEQAKGYELPEGLLQCIEAVLKRRGMNAHPFFTVAYLGISSAQMQWIQEFRQQHDPHFTVAEPHFTLVFGVRDVEELVYLEHVEAIAMASRPIHFRCTYAMLGADDIDDTAYVFLVPNEGNAEVSLLHDRLYTGLLQPFHRLEFPYIPHVTIASTIDFRLAKRLCDGLNHAGVCVEGSLSSISVGVLKDGHLQTLRSFALAAQLKDPTRLR